MRTSKEGPPLVASSWAPHSAASGAALRAALLFGAGTVGLWMLWAYAATAAFDGHALLLVLPGWSFVACGTLVWAQRPGNRLGPIMTGVGMLWLFGRAGQMSSVPVVWTTGIWLTDLWVTGLIVFLLAFPTGRVARGLDWVIVGMSLVVTVPLEFLWLLFLADEGGRNVLLVVANDDAAHVVDRLQRILFTLGAVLLVGSLALRWGRSTGPARRQMAPILVGGVAILLQSVSWMAFSFGAASKVLDASIRISLIAIPAAVLVVLARARMARAGVADLVVELGQTPTPARLRDALANALGDPSLQVAYRAASGDAFVDSGGREVALPDMDGGRAVTMLERGGVPVAAIVHDAALLDDPGLMASVASAMRLAVENDRLTAEVEAQLAEVRASRARIVEAGDRERRRVERDLHDGAQQRLVALSLELRVARSKLGEHPDPAVRQSLDRAADEALAALAELRELALGIHPLVLTESGLGAAVESLADRSPVDVTAEASDDRYPPEVEAAAYFVVSEALANVAKYARATSAGVRIRTDAGVLVVEVRDDGVGGADLRAGSGLRGLADRVAVLDGTLDVVSPTGRGTTVTARIPVRDSGSVSVPAL